jgi:hypothetical protein
MGRSWVGEGGGEMTLRQTLIMRYKDRKIGRESQGPKLRLSSSSVNVKFRKHFPPSGRLF